MKYFGIPKLGAYLAVPVTYNTWLHPDGVSLVTVETEPAADGDGASPLLIMYYIVETLISSY
jgi:ABC-type maltose transport system permease subunit